MLIGLSVVARPASPIRKRNTGNAGEVLRCRGKDDRRVGERGGPVHRGNAILDSWQSLLKNPEWLYENDFADADKGIERLSHRMSNATIIGVGIFDDTAQGTDGF